MSKSLKQRYISSAFLLLAASLVVKIIGAAYKIPLTAYIGAEGRGYFSLAYNYCMPVHALTMGAFPIALTKLISSYNAKGDKQSVSLLKKASGRLFLYIGLIGMLVLLVFARPYSSIVANTPNCIYTILALAPSILFSCLCACNRAFAEGFLDMRLTSISQLLEALFKLVFGILFAKLSLRYMLNSYYESNMIFGSILLSDKQALAYTYPYTSAFSMLGTTLGSIAAYIFSVIYDKIYYKEYNCFQLHKDKYNELLSFSVSLIGATVISSIMNFFDTSTIQYSLSLCDKQVLSTQYSYNGENPYTYVFGIYSTALDFKNLVISAAMAIGTAAVPAVSEAYESSKEKFSIILSNILKYTSILSVLGGIIICLLGENILEIFYKNSSGDIVVNSTEILFLMGVSILPSCLSVTCVYINQALGFASNTILPFFASGIIKVIINLWLIRFNNIDVKGAVISSFVGFLVLMIMNLKIMIVKANVKLRYNEIFFRPVFAGIVAFFIVDYLKNNIIVGMNTLIFTVFFAFILLLFYLFLLILLKSISLNELKSLKF